MIVSLREHTVFGLLMDWKVRENLETLMFKTLMDFDELSMDVNESESSPNEF